MKLRHSLLLAALVAAFGVGSTADLRAQNVGSEIYYNPYTSWVDPVPDLGGLWRLSLHNPTLMDTNNANPPATGAVTDSGTHLPDLLIQDNFTAPGTYDLSATMRSNDDDLFGLVWNYQDADNYFRVGIRQQNAGSFGATRGLAVQKIVGGVVTQISPMGTGPGAPSPLTQEMIDNRTAFDLTVSVDGDNYEVFFDGVSIVSGTDSDLESGRKVGVQSWAQQSDVGTVTPYWGTEVESISVVDGSGTLYSESFDARPVPFRQLVMTNGAGISGNTPGSSREPLGNFGIDVDDPWIFQHSNGFHYATDLGENVLDLNADFIGPAVVVDEAGSENWANYHVRTRIGSTDNDGLGVLVRVQDDDTFYRVTFSSESIGSNPAQMRAPQGLSVQKVQDGVWSQLFIEDQDNPAFVYFENPTGLTPNDGDFDAFDLSVKAIENALYVQVTDADGNVFNYDPIIDNDNPLMTGTAGLHTWGTDTVYFMEYGGAGSGTPFVSYIPEPATVALGGIAALGLVALRRRSRVSGK